jgi:hypothetical protein
MTQGPHRLRIAFVALQAVCLFVLLPNKSNAQRPEDVRLEINRSQVTLGEAIALSWSVPNGTTNVYISSLEAGIPQPGRRQNGVITFNPSSSTDFVLFAETAAGVLTKTAHVSVSGARGSATLLNVEDLSCTVRLPLRNPQPLALLMSAQQMLETRALVVDQEFMRGSEFVLQTKPGALKPDPASGNSVRQLIYQVAFGLNLVGSAKGAGSIVAVQLGSQLRFRRPQEAQWNVDADTARCLDQARAVEQPLRDLLKD